MKRINPPVPVFGPLPQVSEAEFHRLTDHLPWEKIFKAWQKGAPEDADSREALKREVAAKLLFLERVGKVPDWTGKPWPDDERNNLVGWS